MKYKYQHIIDEENEKLRQKLAPIKRERNIYMGLVILAQICLVIWYFFFC